MGHPMWRRQNELWYADSMVTANRACARKPHHPPSLGTWCHLPQNHRLDGSDGEGANWRFRPKPDGQIFWLSVGYVPKAVKRLSN